MQSLKFRAHVQSSLKCILPLQKFKTRITKCNFQNIKWIANVKSRAMICETRVGGQTSESWVISRWAQKVHSNNITEMLHHIEWRFNNSILVSHLDIIPPDWKLCIQRMTIINDVINYYLATWSVFTSLNPERVFALGQLLAFAPLSNWLKCTSVLFLY